MTPTTHLTAAIGRLEAGVIELIERLGLKERTRVRLLHVVQVSVRQQRRVRQSDARTRRGRRGLRRYSPSVNLNPVRSDKQFRPLSRSTHHIGESYVELLERGQFLFVDAAHPGNVRHDDGCRRVQVKVGHGAARNAGKQIDLNLPFL